MSVEIVTPRLGKIKKSTKDLVISTLVHEYPLSLAKLTNSIKKLYGAGVTFQGVRKAANQLVEEGVLVKEGKNYRLNKEWIRRMRDFVEKLESRYFTESGRARDVESIGEDIKVYTFDNLIDLDEFWNRVIAKWFEEDKENKGKKYYTQQSGHTWYVLANLEEETDILEKIKKHKINFYTLVPGRTVLDQWCKKYYEEHGFYYTVNKKEKKNTSQYFAVYGDNIIQSDYPEELAKNIDALYEKAKDFESFEVTKLIKLLRKKSDVKITVMKNPVVAQQLRNYILSHFKKK
jgi:hypothetical protein